MSKLYKVPFYEDNAGFIYFEADNIEHAKQLLTDIDEGNSWVDDLPNYERSTKNGQFDVDIECLEEII